MLGSEFEIKLKKSKLNPTARGISPSTVVIAVRSTGRSLVSPPLMIDFTTSSFGNSSPSERPSSSRLFFIVID